MMAMDVQVSETRRPTGGRQATQAERFAGAAQSPQGGSMNTQRRVALLLPAIIIASVTVCMLALVVFTYVSERVSLRELAEAEGNKITEVLSSQLTQAVRWEKTEQIHQLFAPFAGEEIGLTGFIALRRTATGLKQLADANISAPKAFEVAQYADDLTAPGQVHMGDVSVFVVPVRIPSREAPIGYFATVWDLSFIDQRAMQDAVPNAIAALLAIAILAVLLLHMVRRFVTEPMIQKEDELSQYVERLSGAKQTLEAQSNELMEHRHLLQEQIDARTAELAEALERQQELNQQQRHFVSMVSHEFRTPLAVIDGCAQRLERKIRSLPEDHGLDDRLQKIRFSVRRLTLMMEGTLSVARMDSGTLQVNVTTCEFRALVDDLCKQQQEISKQHEITVDIDDLPERIDADLSQLMQIFSNLLSNAVKYSPDDPRVVVRGWEDDGFACVAVTDHGVGIPVKEQEKICGRFFRASTSNGISGTGIGLNLVKRLVEMHGGELGLQSEAGAGSTFTVRLPIAGAGQRHADTPAPIGVSTAA